MAIEVKDFKVRLEQDRQEVKQELDSLTSLEDFGEGIRTENAGHGTHMADHSSDTYEKEQRLTLQMNLKNRVDEIDRALHRIELGIFGLCESCRQPIEEARLEALPFATFCLSCTERQEKRRAS